MRQKPQATFRSYLFGVATGLILAVSNLAWSGLAPSAQAATGINSQINFQARLFTAAGAVVPDGNYNLEFKIYQDGTGCVSGGSSPCGGTLKWTEAWLNNNSQSIVVRNGYFSVQLGSITSLSTVDFNQSVNWLSMNVGNTNPTCTPFSSCSGDGEMLPFQRFGSAAYSFNSAKLQGLDSTQFTQLAQGLQTDASTANASIAINKTGITANILQLQRGGADVEVIANDGSALFKNQTDSVTGFRIQSATAAQTLFTADTTANKIKIGDSTGTDTATTLLVVDSATANPTTLTGRNGGLFYDSALDQLKVVENGAVARVCTTTSVCSGYAPSAGSGYVQFAPASVQVDSSTNNTVFINKTGASGNIVELQKGGVDVLTVGNTGAVLSKNSTDSAIALQIQNATGQSLFNLSTISTTQNLITNPSFESNTTGWTGLTGGDTLSTTSSAAALVSGTQALLDTTTATANRGVKYVYPFKPNTQYTFSVYVAVSSGSTGAFFELDHVENSTVLTTGCPITQTLTTTMTRFTCTFTTGATILSTDRVQARYTDATNAYNLYFDAAQLEYGSSATTFADQPYPNLVTNPSIESNTNGWSAKGTSTTTSSGEFAQYGTRSLKIVTSTSANNGASYSYNFQPNSQYTLSLWARRDTSTASTFNIGRADNGSDTDCLTGRTFNTTWANFTCTFTTGATIGSTANFYIKQSDTATDNIYIDGVTLVASGTAQIYNAGGSSLQVESLYNNITLNGTNTGEIQPWQTNANPLPSGRYGPSSFTANGYAYVVGGDNGTGGTWGGLQTTVYYAKLNADGSTGSWSTSPNSLPGARGAHASVVVNGYAYVMGGTSSPTTVYYAKLNADGSTGIWKTNANSLWGSGGYSSAVTANGYIYVMGGESGVQWSVFYAKVNADGSTGAWQNGTILPGAGRTGAASITANGYVYVIGGYDNSIVNQTTVLYAKLNADGSIGSWNSSPNALPEFRNIANAVTLNGYVYLIGGGNPSTIAATTLYAKLNVDGSTGTWQTSTNLLPATVSTPSSLTANGYIYLIGGLTASVQSTVYYTSTSRILAGGSLDLVGLGGQSLNDVGGTGGSLTAVNGTFLGDIQAQGQANILQGATIGNNLIVNGSELLKGSAGSTSILQVQNSGGVNALSISTVNLIGNPSFESGTNATTPEGWAAKGAGVPTIDNTQANFGTNSMKVVTTTAANDGAKYSIAFAAVSTQYTLSLYAKVSSGSITDFVVGHQESGSDVTCLTGQTVTTTWTRFSCTFTSTGATNSHYIFVQKSGVSAETFFIDGVQLESSATVSSYRESDIAFDGLTTFRSSGNSTTAFQIQNSAGANVLVIDSTLNDNNLITNPSFEANTTGWLVLDGNGISRSTAQSYSGQASLLAVPDGLSNGGSAKYNINLSNSTTYTASFYIKSAAASSSFYMGYADSGNCTPNTSTATNAGWTYVTCTFTTPGSGSGSSYFYIGQSYPTNSSIFIDAVKIELGSSPTAYAGVISSPTTFRGSNNTTNAFQIQNTSNSAIFSADTLNNRIGIGVSTPLASLHISSSATTPLFRVTDATSAAVDVLNIADEGATTFRSRTDSNAAFQIQNANGSSVLKLDTTLNTSNLITNPSFEANTTGWLVLDGNGISRSTAQSYSGQASLLAVPDGLSNGGSAKYNINLSNSTTYTASFYIKSAAASSSFYMGYADSGNCTPNTSTATNAGWTYVTCTFTTPGSGSGSSYFYIGQSYPTNSSIFIDAVSIEQGSSPLGYRESSLQYYGTVNSPLILQNRSFNTTSAFQVQNSSGVSILNVDSINQRVGIGLTSPAETLDVNGGVRIATLNATSGSTAVCRNASNQLSVCSSNPTTVTLQNSYDASTGSTTPEIKLDSTRGALDIQDANTTIAGNLLNIRASNAGGLGSVMLGVGNTGQVTLQNSVDSSTALKIQNSSGTNLLNVSTVSNTQNLITNASFESNTIGWAGLTGGDTLANTATVAAVQSGSQALQYNSAAVANRGVKYTYQFKPNTQYTFSIYAAVGAGSTGAFFELDHVENGSTLTTGCPTTQTLSTTRARFTCTFTTGATILSTDGVQVRYTDAATVYLFYFDAAQLEYGSAATTFADQSYPNLVTNPSIESNTNGWSAKGTATISSSDEFAQYGVRSLKMVTSTSANNGASYSYNFQPSSRYTLSLWARRDTSTASTFNIGRADNGSDTDCLTGQTFNTTWTNFTCTFTTGATIGSTSNFYVKQTDTTSDNIYIDGVTLVASGSAQTYNTGGSSIQVEPLYNNITLNGSNTGEIQPWQLSGNALPGIRANANTVTANGYIYEIGGNDASNTQSTVYYAKLNTDGSTGAWNTNVNSLPATRQNASSTVVNGYIYIIGGKDGAGTYQATVFYAKLNADGSTGPWQTNANPLFASRANGMVASANGYIYFGGGTDSLNAARTTFFYAKLNSDGSTGPWTFINNTPGNKQSALGLIANGYFYVISGHDGASNVTAVIYAKINNDGTLGSWSTNANPLPSGRSSATGTVLNGYVYVIGGISSAGTTATVYFAKLNNDGSTGAWNVSGNSLPQNIQSASGISSNGYVYVLGGTGGSGNLATIYYTSTSRILAGGSLDLVGLGGQSLNDVGGTGGSLTAVNGTFLGDIQAQGQANFVQGATVGNNLTVNGSALVKALPGSPNILQVQNSGGVNALSISTVNLMGNASFESGTTGTTPDGWAAKGAGAPTTVNTQANFGTNSMQVVTTTAANDGAKAAFIFGTSTQYTLSLYAKVSSGSITDFVVGRQDNGSDITCLTAQTVTTTWTRFTCTFTTGGTINGSNIFVQKSGVAAETFFIDGVQLERAASASVYRETDLGFDGQITLNNSANLNGTQTHILQNANISGAIGGTTRGYQFNSTITTTNVNTNIGFEINQTDSATALANLNTGLKISLAGSNSGQNQTGIDVSVSKGIGSKLVSTGDSGGSVTCNAFTGNLSIGLCAGSTSTTSASYGVIGHSVSLGGVGVVGINNAAGSGAGSFYGVQGFATQTVNNASRSIGVYGEGQSIGPSGTAYGGYFNVSSGNTATTGAVLFSNNNSSVALDIFKVADNGNNVFTVADQGNTTLSPLASTSGTPTILTVTAPAHTGLTNAEAIDANLNLARSVTFTGGAATSFGTQRALVVQAPTYAATTGTLTITDAATQAITGAPVKGSNVAITNSHALLIQSGAVSAATNSYGLTVNAQTGAGANYTAAFLGGNVGVGTASPDSKLHVVGGGVCVEVSDSGCAAASGSLTINGPSSGDAFTVSNDGSSGNIAVFKDSATTVASIADGGSALFKNSADSATALRVQNQNSKNVLSVDTSAGKVTLGEGSNVNGSLVFSNSTNGNTVTFNSGITSGSYGLTLPTAQGAFEECMRNNGSGVLSWTGCGAASGTLQGVYDASVAPAGITTANDKNIVITAADTANDSGVIFNLQCTTCTTGTNSNGGQFQIQAAGTNVFTIAPSGSTGVTTLVGTFLQKSNSATAFVLQNTSNENALLFDGSTKHLKVFENVGSPTRYADIYYDNSTSEAVFAASSGVTRIGSGSGNVTIPLTGQTDVLNFTKTYTAAASYNQSEFNITRDVTGGSNALTGNVAKIEDLSTFSGGSSAANLLYINQNNTGATGNLILAQTGAANDKFKVSVAGTVTIASGQSYTGSGAVNVTSGAGTALTVTSATAATWSTTSGTLTLQAGGANKIVAKPGTDSTSSFEVQKASGSLMFSADTTNSRLYVGPTAGDTIGTILVLGNKTNAGDPTGVNGSMYYNSSVGKFRCYENNLWLDCLGRHNLLQVTGDVVNNNGTANTLADVTGLTWSVANGTMYTFQCTIYYTAAAATTGSRWTINGPATSAIWYNSKYTLTATTYTTNDPLTAINLPAASSASSSTTTANIATISGFFVPSAGGTAAIRFASEVSGSAITAKAGSTCEWW